MRISTKGRHAVMAMVDLARRGRGKPITPVPLAEIAQRQDISLSYLEQLIAMLKAEGLVKSVRGPGGGYMLARPGNEITVAQIVAAVDDHQPRISIDNPDEASGRQLTDLLWQAIGDEINGYLSTISLADVDTCALCITPANDKEGFGGRDVSKGGDTLPTSGKDDPRKVEAGSSIPPEAVTCF